MTSIRFLGWRPMSALALLDASVLSPYSAALHSVVYLSSILLSSDMFAVEFDVVVVYAIEVGKYVSPIDIGSPLRMSIGTSVV